MLAGKTPQLDEKVLEGWNHYTIQDELLCSGIQLEGHKSRLVCLVIIPQTWPTSGQAMYFTSISSSVFRNTFILQDQI
ncbi:MAG TPA: hypothetical protein DIS88_07920 [Prevotella sp.]|nr:hypothetical protein [Prevotella sp.]